MFNVEINGVVKTKKMKTHKSDRSETAQECVEDTNVLYTDDAILFVENEQNLPKKKKNGERI